MKEKIHLEYWEDEPQMVIRSVYGEFYNEIARENGLPKIYYLGCDLSPDKLAQTLKMISNCNWLVIYISKSGGTMEPALAFRVLWEQLLAKYGEEGANKRVYAIAGIDTDAILKGAIDAMNDCKNNDKNFAVQYAMWRQDNYDNGYFIDLFATNTPDMHFTTEWLKQLFGESEGKEREGLFPASVTFPTDLHSLGQYLQDGTKSIDKFKLI